MTDEDAKQLAADKRLLDRIDQFGKGLTTYEKGFVESALRRLDAGQALSDKQRKLADDIDERRVG